jgi:uncharacterized protein YndB with AHSA1/START domain
MPNVVRLHRVPRANPDRVFRAFTDPAAMVKWLTPNGFTAQVHRMDARVGDSHKMSSRISRPARATRSAASTWR